MSIKGLILAEELKFLAIAEEKPKENSGSVRI